MRKMLLLAIFAAVVPLPVFAQSAADIQTRNDALAAAFARHDGAAVRAIYGEKAYVLPDRGEMVHGKALLPFWRAVVARIGGFKRKTTDVEPLGPGFAREIGRFTFRNRRDLRETSGKYVAVWRQTGGDWKLVTDIWNTDR